MTLEQRVEALETELTSLKSQLAESNHSSSCGVISKTYTVQVNQEDEGSGID